MCVDNVTSVFCDPNIVLVDTITEGLVYREAKALGCVALERAGIEGGTCVAS